jgi:ADP-ribose pyrophosphatase YjhB (NUDIX family)
MYLYIYDKNLKEWFILVSKRGPGCPSAVGKWNVPGGYLDFDETLEEAARRECYEETGVRFDGPLTLASISTNPHSKAQNVVCSFYGVIKVNSAMEIVRKLDKRNCNGEKDEVDDIGLWTVKDIIARPELYANGTAFGHDKMIVSIFKTRIKCSWFKKMIIKWGEKLSKIKLEIL